MAEFKKAHEVLKKFEGGYVNDPHDRGAETINGISRRFFPDFKGWEIVDEHKKQHADLKVFKKALHEDETLNRYSESFYKLVFWEKMKLDSINSDLIAGKMYLFGVNAGIKRANQFAQSVANILLGASLKVDGVIGEKSLEAINQCDEKIFKEAYSKKEVEYYEGLAKKDKTQERFLKGWINRTKAFDKD